MAEYNYDYLNSDVPEELETYHGFPFIQWVNRGNSLIPTQATGGFAAPADQGIPLTGEYCQLVHANGDTTEVFFTTELTIVPVAHRFAWVLDGTLVNEYTPGARGKLQVLAWVKTEEGVQGPVVLTMKGIAGKTLNAALREHSHFVAVALRDKVKKPLPWFVWATLRAGKPRMEGQGRQKSLVTPVEYVEANSPELIGKALYDEIVSYASDIARWKQAWKDNAPKPNGDGEVEVAEEE